jgi:hypothetical protein
MLKLVMETSSFAWSAAGLETGQGWLSYILPKYALVSDEIYYVGEPIENDLLTLSTAYGKLVPIPSDFLLLSKGLPKPTQEQLDDLGIAFGDEYGGECSELSYFGTMALFEYTKSINAYFYVLPGLREGFINFCLKNKRSFLSNMKESFLFCSIVDFLFEHHIPAFEPAESITNLDLFEEFKIDFQKGIEFYAKKFEGSYELSDEQRAYLKESIANDEQRLFEFLQPENLKECNISKASILSDAIGLFLQLPIGTLIELGKELKKVQEFENANLGFILSLTVLKRIANIGKIERSIHCPVCAISPAEIENMTDEQCDKIMYRDDLCLAHLIARLDLKKRFHLYGKHRLREMKRLGDASIWINPKDE